VWRNLSVQISNFCLHLNTLISEKGNNNTLFSLKSVNLISCYIKLVKYNTNKEQFERNTVIIMPRKTSHGWRK